MIDRVYTILRRSAFSRRNPVYTESVRSHMVRTCKLIPFLVLAASAAGADQDFSLKDGDTVVFYGDSITDQRLYTTLAETYVVTRFPALHVRFVHSGWGGDKVTGGGGGPIVCGLRPGRG